MCEYLIHEGLEQDITSNALRPSYVRYMCEYLRYMCEYLRYTCEYLRYTCEYLRYMCEYRM